MTSIAASSSSSPMSSIAQQQHQPSTSAANVSKKTATPSTVTTMGTTTLDALTSTMQASHLAEKGSMAYSEIDPELFKSLLLKEYKSADAEGGKEATGSFSAASSSSLSSSSTSLPPLSVLLHDRIWAHGGELVMQIGEVPSSEQNGEGSSTSAPKKMANVDQVKVKFSSTELATAIRNISQACSEAACEATTLFESSKEESSSSYAYLMLRRIPAGAQELLELRIAVIGNVDAGKSSTLGVLTRGGLDDGRGKARVNLFRHKHEIESGRTSSVGMEILGFDTKGDVVMNIDKKNTSEPGRKMSWEEVCEKSAKVISFIDLAGHERYLKTTVGGLTGCLPDFVMLMVGANAGLIGMSKEHLGVALALALPVLVCITKVDMTPPHILEATLKQLTKILRSPGCRKTPVFIETQEQAIETALRLGNERICPVFQISNVTGQNLNLLRSFLNILPQANSAKFSPEAPFKFQLQDVFSVPFVGCVVSGVILSGVVRIGDNLVIGPDSLGQFVNTSVRSIQRKRVNVDTASAGQSASFALKRIRRNQVRKGMVMLGKSESPPRAYLTCDAEILCLYHSTTLTIGSNMVFHAASIRQTVKIVQIAKLDGQGKIIASSTREHPQDTASSAANRSKTDANLERPVVRTGDRALLRLQFISHVEAVEEGLKIITREGRTKTIGTVIRCGATGSLSSGYEMENQTTGSTAALTAGPAAATV